MKKNNIKLLIFEIILIIALLIEFFMLKENNNIRLMIILVVFSLLLKILFKKNKILVKSRTSKEVNYLNVGFAILYLGIFYLLGLLHYDFVRLPITFGLKTIFINIIPITLIIISTEFIRLKLILQEINFIIFNKKINISKLLSFIIVILIDLIIYTKIYDISKIDGALAIIGFVLFPSISSTLYYDYITKRYGNKGIIVYRIMTSIYSYIIPIIPDMHIYSRSFLRMLYPYLMYLIVDKTYSKNSYVIAGSFERKNIFKIIATVVLALSITVLISCEFKYGIIVIGSGSMKGSMDIGDAVIFEKYTNQTINIGQVILFEKNGIRIVHRVTDKKNINGELKYFTKGDANAEVDNWYLTKRDIVGIINFKLKYLGYPTIWLNSLFN